MLCPLKRYRPTCIFVVLHNYNMRYDISHEATDAENNSRPEYWIICKSNELWFRCSGGESLPSLFFGLPNRESIDALIKQHTYARSPVRAYAPGCDVDVMKQAYFEFNKGSHFFFFLDNCLWCYGYWFGFVQNLMMVNLGAVCGVYAYLVYPVRHAPCDFLIFGRLSDMLNCFCADKDDQSLSIPIHIQLLT